MWDWVLGVVEQKLDARVANGVGLEAWISATQHMVAAISQSFSPIILCLGVSTARSTYTVYDAQSSDLSLAVAWVAVARIGQ